MHAALRPVTERIEKRAQASLRYGGAVSVRAPWAGSGERCGRAQSEENNEALALAGRGQCAAVGASALALRCVVEP